MESLTKYELYTLSSLASRESRKLANRAAKVGFVPEEGHYDMTIVRSQWLADVAAHCLVIAKNAPEGKRPPGSGGDR